MRARQQLAEQNVALDNARAEAERAIRARNDFLAVMNHEMRTPMHAIIALSTLLQVGSSHWEPVFSPSLPPRTAPGSSPSMPENP